jgi:hypothetical protein
MSKYENKIACLPTLAANNGLADALHFSDGTFYKNVTTTVPITSAAGLGYQYASQVATSPSAATSAGYVFTFENGALSAKPTDLGPLLSDLPQTIGRNRLYVGASYQWMQFSKTGGKSLNSFIYSGGMIDPYEGGYNYIQASASLKMHSINTYLSYGISDRLDVSAVIPWSRTEMRIHTSCAPNSYGVDDTWSSTSTGESLCEQHAPVSVPVTVSGTTYIFDVYDYSFTALNSKAQTASGLGDVTLRGKYEILKKSRQGAALGLEYRLPTGDPLNMQGSGATGIRPFLAWSYNSRVSPHANVGYQYNGSSASDVNDIGSITSESVTGINYDTSETETIDVTTGIHFTDKLKARKLPNIVTVSAGADYALSDRVNLNADLLVRHLSNDGTKVFGESIGDVQLNKNYITNAPFFDGASTKTTFVIGEKGKITDHLLFSANLQIDASNNGLSYRPSPIATLSYDFGGGSKK